MTGTRRRQKMRVILLLISISSMMMMVMKEKMVMEVLQITRMINLVDQSLRIIFIHGMRL
jgi:hypothetical protein